MVRLPIAAVLLTGLGACKGAKERNPPDWPASVKVFDASDDVDEINDVVSAAYETNGGDEDNGQFSHERYAFLFKPGSYVGVEVPVGYYTSVLGLGRAVGETRFEGGGKQVYCEEGDTSDYTVGALDTFWREASNFYTDADYGWWDGASGMLWAASQASPLRRVHTANDLLLYQYVPGDASAGYSSGGFLADSFIQGTVQVGSQQQYMILNSSMDDVTGGAWNIVMAGARIQSGIESSCSEDRGVVIVNDDEALLRRNTRGAITTKPYIVFENDRFILVTSTGDIDFDSVLVVSPQAKNWTARFDDIDAWLLSPGVYNNLSQIVISKTNFVLLGLGMATLRTSLVIDAPGVTVAGIIIDAIGPGTTSLMTWSGNNGILTDVFFRIGNFDNNFTINAAADTGLYVSGQSLLVENIWIWRADHDVNGEVLSQTYPLNVAAVIAGMNTDVFGFAAEHALNFQMHWTGNDGTLFFFQTEYAYDSIASFNQPGYLVEAEGHTAYGVGVYAYFRDAAANVSTAIKAPADALFVSPLSVFLNGIGTISSVFNGRGLPVGPDSTSQVYHLCTDLSGDSSPSSPHKKTANFPQELEHDLRRMAIALLVVALFGLLTAVTLMRRHASKMLGEDDSEDIDPASLTSTHQNDDDSTFELSISLLGAQSQQRRQAPSGVRSAAARHQGRRQPPPSVPLHLLAHEVADPATPLSMVNGRQKNLSTSSTVSSSNSSSTYLSDDDDYSPSNRVTL